MGIMVVLPSNVRSHCLLFDRYLSLKSRGIITRLLLRMSRVTLRTVYVNLLVVNMSLSDNVSKANSVKAKAKAGVTVARTEDKMKPKPVHLHNFTNAETMKQVLSIWICM